MSKVREFWLTNSSNIKYSLQNVDTFLNQPEGLGFNVDISTIKVGNSNLIVSDNYNLPNIIGEILFMKKRIEAYQQYYEFAQFLYEKPIYLHYMPANTNSSYYCQVRVVEVDKTEVNYQDGMLHVPISMYRQTMWYTDDINTIEVTQEAQEGKHYELQRPYHYGVVSTSNIPIYNAGVNETPLLVEIDGQVTDPSYSLFDNENVLYGRAKILGSYDYVSINSDDLQENISLMRNGAYIPNAINYQDLSVGDPRKVFVTFLKLKPGQSRLAFNLEGSTGVKVRISWRNAYVTV